MARIPEEAPVTTASPIGRVSIFFLSASTVLRLRYLQASLQQIQFDATGIAELSQRILATHGSRFDLLRSQVGLGIRAHDGINDPFRFLQNGFRGTEANAAQQR